MNRSKTTFQSSSLYQKENLNLSILVGVISLAMVAVSIYLTQHYFNVKFPSGLSSGSLCNLNAIFNCDKTTLSPLGAPFNIPISIFGIIIGFLSFLGIIIKNEEYEKTIYSTLIVNALGCLVLFFYSLFILKGLCPFCTIYYLLSFAMLYLFYKHSTFSLPNLPILLIFVLATAAIAYITQTNVNKKIENLSSIGADLIKQYYELPNLGRPQVESPFKLATATNPAIRMDIYSDFECPACKALSEQVPAIVEKYKNQIEINYYYYPLDMNCNPEMKNPLHQFACKAAYVASCVPNEKFYEVHEEIFNHQNELASGYLDQLIKKFSIEQCVTDEKTKKTVQSLIATAQAFSLSSTPTFLVNGVKIEGALPLDQLTIIFDEIIKRHQNK